MYEAGSMRANVGKDGGGDHIGRGAAHVCCPPILVDVYIA